MSSRLQSTQWTDGQKALPPLVPACFHESDEEDVNQNHTPIDIYQHFGLPPGTPICLDSLQDPSPGERPAYTYATLVKLAIWSSPQRKLTLSAIYAALEKRFPWFRDCQNPNAWKTSIRHCLSLLSIFVKLPMDIHVPGKGCHWTIDFSKGDGYKRPRKRGAKKLPTTLEVATSDISNSTTAPSGSEAGTPVDSGKPVMTQVGDGEVTEEYANRSSEPQRKTVELAAASPDPQFRHYRMCTYLYPSEDGPPVPVSASPSEVWSIVGETNGPPQDEPEPSTHPRRTRSSRSSRRSDPIASRSRRGRRTALNRTNEGILPEGEEYFYPSLASFQAYCAATGTQQKTFVWRNVPAPDPPANTASETSSPGDDKGSRWYYPTENSIKHKGQSDHVGVDSVVGANSSGRSLRSTSSPVESEPEEEEG